MRGLCICVLTVWSAGAAVPPVIPGDSERGARLFENQRCVECHSVNGKGGKMGMDLSARVDRGFTPALLASAMWNHAPVMWAAMEGAGMERPKLSPSDAADLFAYLYSTRFFDRPGDAARGKQAFTDRHCAECHGITESRAEGAPPVVKWESLGQPRSEERRVGSDWSSDVCSSDLRARQTSVHGQALRGVPRDYRVAGGRRAAGSEVGIAGAAHGPGATDVGPQQPHAGGLRAQEDRVAGADGAGFERYSGLSAQPAGDAGTGGAFLVYFGGGGASHLRIQGLREMPCGQAGCSGMSSTRGFMRRKPPHPSPPPTRSSINFFNCTSGVMGAPR